ncbi:MAG: RNA-guided pseudouridylation complex pseudouridine synthase subunit Cbf5 [Nanohaloarchaea archaeon SW_7_43_1]|nr:MAG: RNA-guided pseudouridylation complex pseudouridine synthase subunit Cbf5 [Nanohaloarchaea archaeon SW_7_43_1]
MKSAKWYTKEQAETDPEFGSIPKEGSIEELMEKGIILLDKPFGPQSNQVSTWIKKELNVKKTGHFGTLDPNATGILPIGVNKGTRASKAMSKTDKEYIFEAELGEGKNKAKIREVLKSFKGVNRQLPPEKSAVKREEREREAYETELLEVEEKRILGRVKCESGFYVRVLISQLGEKLDTEAEMEELRRTQQADISETETNTLQEIVDAYHYYNEGDEEELRKVLCPIEKAINHLRKIAIKDSAVNAVANGADLGTQGISKLQDGIKEGERVAITTLKGELIALGTAEMTSEQMFDKDDKAVTLESVHMKPETYPKRWKQ